VPADRPKHDPVPEWASFFEESRYAAFLDAVVRDLSARSEDVEIDDGIAHVLMPNEEVHAFGLQNLAQICNQAEDEDWPEIIGHHFDGVLRSTTGADLEGIGKDFERVQGLLKVRLYPFDAVEDSLDGLAYRVIADGLVAVLAYDLPDAVATVPRSDVDAWPIDFDQAFELGLNNVLAERDIEHERIELESGAVFSAMVGDSFFVTSRLLALERFISPTSAYGALVAVPNRHTLLWASIVDLGILETLNALLVIAHRRHAEGPGSLSSLVYWWHDGEMLALPASLDDGRLQFFPPEEFVEECLNELPEPTDAGFGPN
jgi:hypothetical protein